MIRTFMILGVTWVLAVPPDHQIPKVRSRVFDVHYELASGPLPLEVELWYTLDRGQLWHRYGFDADRRSPFAMTAPAEGLYGLYLVAANGNGTSAPAPQTGTTPHTWIFVDYTPPICQLFELAQSSAEQRPQTVIVRWAVIDDYLAHQPISLSYRADPGDDWQPIAQDLSNVGAYHWRVPGDLSGDTEIRLTAVDRAGNRSQCEQPWQLEQAPVEATASLDSPGQLLVSDAPQATSPMPIVNEDAVTRIIHEAEAALAIGDEVLAVDRFRDALRADPNNPETLVKLGKALYAAGHLPEAARAFQEVLGDQPRQRDAVIGLSRTLVRQRRFDEAERVLTHWVDTETDDPDAWMHLGDIAVYRGTEVEAQMRYRQAKALALPGSKIYAAALQRLQSVALLTQEFKQESGQDQARR